MLQFLHMRCCQPYYHQIFPDACGSFRHSNDQMANALTLSFSPSLVKSNEQLCHTPSECSPVLASKKSVLISSTIVSPSCCVFPGQWHVYVKSTMLQVFRQILLHSFCFQRTLDQCHLWEDYEHVRGWKQWGE